ncbi:MAG TPA: ABC transporter substrate-binding protein [Anaerolineales bacterium]|nr:ABC transporter substrate-binding protein [Anaerolineales bacterium]
MSKISKILGLLMVFTLLLAACGGGQGTQAPTTAAPTEAMTEEPTEAPTEAMTEAPTEAPTEAMTEAPVAGEIDCMGAAEGDEISMLYQWAGAEEAALNQVLQPLLDACGIVLRPESTRDQALLDTRVQAGTPPDVAFWQVSQLVQYQDQLIPMDELGANADGYSDFFLDPVTIDGRWLGLPIKADVKSIIWYSPANFEALGYEVPETWEDLEALVDQMVADGQVPWSLGFESGDATGWTGTDFLQDIMLVQQGPEFVLGVIDGSVPYNDPGVQQAYETYGAWATDPTYTVGGAQGTLSTPFLEAIYKPFADPPEAMMVKQSGFAGAEIAKQFPDLQQGTDYDFFVVPGIQGLQGSIEPMMAFNDTPAVRALVAYLSSEQGGANWAGATFGLSPNAGATGNYADPALQKLGDAIAETEGFTPDIGDTIPGGFGSAEFQGVSEYVNGGDLQAILDNLADVQADGLNQ